MGAQLHVTMVTKKKPKNNAYMELCAKLLKLLNVHHYVLLNFLQTQFIFLFEIAIGDKVWLKNYKYFLLFQSSVPGICIGEPNTFCKCVCPIMAYKHMNIHIPK